MKILQNKAKVAKKIAKFFGWIIFGLVVILLSTCFFATLIGIWLDV
jgi:hypothetical protein